MPDPEDTGDTPEPAEAADAEAPEDVQSFTSADFHNVVQKHILNTVYETLVETKLEWSLVAPFLEAARDICRADFEEGAEIRVHAVRADGDAWVDADEAYLGISVADRDDGSEWLSETYWLSELAIAEDDPKQVRAIVGALERSIAKINAWLAEKEGGAVGAAPPEGSSS